MSGKRTTSLEEVKLLDGADSLASFRQRFFVKEDEIYMDGNSLGLASLDAKEALYKAYQVWEDEGIKLWGVENGKYFNYARNIAKLFCPLLNAEAEELIVSGSITSNLHQALASFYQPSSQRYKIVVDELNFPTDIYAVESILTLKGQDVSKSLVKVESADACCLDEDVIVKAMTEDVALILLPSVLYRSAQLLNMQYITTEAKKRDIVIGWDLAHSIGAVPHDFKAIQPDFATWCTYKYLNGGPGSCAGLYINKKHFNKAAGLKGWFGNKDDKQFLLSQSFDQAHDAGGWQQGSPHIFSMAPLEGSLRIFCEAGIHEIRRKSLKLTQLLMDLADEVLLQYGFRITNPREEHRRGGHVALEHADAYRISLALRDAGVVPDFREPNVIRLAPAALYIRYEDVYRLVEKLERIMKDTVYEQYSQDRGTVV